MKPGFIGILLVLALLLAGAYFYAKDIFEPAPVEEIRYNLYANGRYGISFPYPSGYILAEREAAEGHYAITLVREEDAALPENGEGPTAITIDIYDAGDLTLDAWRTERNESNFGLGDGTYATTSVDGAEAVSYRWSGLYEGETTAFVHNGNIIAVSATHLTPEDQIRSDFEALLSSFSLR